MPWFPLRRIHRRRRPIPEPEPRFLFGIGTAWALWLGGEGSSAGAAAKSNVCEGPTMTVGTSVLNFHVKFLVEFILQYLCSKN